MMKTRVRWDDRYYLRVYQYARNGLSRSAICAALGIGTTAFESWMKKRPALAEALAEGIAGASKEGGFREFIYKRLPPDMQEVWDRIDLCETTPHGVVKVEEILRDKGTVFRQHLFLYALVHSGFDASEACRKVNISVRVLDSWKNTDMDFARLVEEIHWHKGNFFETALVDAVARGDSPAILFANKTFNRDRGYGEKTEIHINKKVEIEHTIRNEVTIRLDKLSLEKRKQILCILEESESNPSGDLGGNHGEVLRIGDGGRDGGSSFPRQVIEIQPR